MLRKPADEVAEFLDEAASDGIVTVRAQGLWGFGHAVLRNALLDRLGTVDGARLNQRTGEALEALHPSHIAPYLARLAHHFASASALGGTDRAIYYSIRAGAAARAVGALEEATTLWETALQLIDQLPDGREQRARLLEQYGEVLFESGIAGVKGRQYLEEALRISHELGLVDLLPDIHRHLGFAFGPLAGEQALDIDRAIKHFHQAEAMTPPNSRAMGFIYIGMALVTFMKSRIRDALEYSRKGMAVGEEIGDEEVWVQSANCCAQDLFCLGKISESFALLEQAWCRARGTRDMRLVREVAWFAASLHGWILDPETQRGWLISSASIPGRPEWQVEKRGRILLLAYSHMLQGDVAEARRLMPLATQSPHLKGALTFQDGEWEQALEMQAQGLAWVKSRGSSYDILMRSRDVATSLSALGRVGEAESVLREAIPIAVEGPVLPEELMLRGQLAMALIQQSRLDEARANLDRCRAIIGNGEDRRGLVGFLESIEAPFAAAAGRSREADDRFQHAINILRRFRLRWYETGALLGWAWKFKLEGNLQAAESKFGEAETLLHQMGMNPRFIERALPPKDIRPVMPKAETDTAAVFRCEGDFWTISFNGRQSRVKNNTGIEQIARMLREPGRSFDVRELADQSRSVARNGSPPPQALARDFSIACDLGDAEPVLDNQARNEYKARLAELREELDSAERDHDIGRTQALRAEIEAIVHELSAAYGLGGRSRKESSHLERARSSVTKNIKKGIANIGETLPALARHLSSTIKTGYLCSYTPDPDRPVRWSL